MSPSQAGSRHSSSWRILGSARDLFPFSSKSKIIRKWAEILILFHQQIFGFWFWKVNVCCRVLVWRLLHAAHCTVIVLMTFDFERKKKQIIIAHQKEVVDGKSTSRTNKKGPLCGVSKHISNMWKKNYGFRHFGNFVTDPRSPAIEFFRTGLTYLPGTPCEVIFSQSTWCWGGKNSYERLKL